MQQVDEVAEIIDDTVIRVRHTPLHVTVERCQPTSPSTNGVQVVCVIGTRLQAIYTY